MVVRVPVQTDQDGGQAQLLGVAEPGLGPEQRPQQREVGGPAVVLRRAQHGCAAHWVLRDLGPACAARAQGCEVRVPGCEDGLPPGWAREIIQQRVGAALVRVEEHEVGLRAAQ
ncbi:hypothetical protein GCM10025734_81100 [Kitasatospora paranensis]